MPIKEEHNEKERKMKKRMPIWKMVLIDIGALAVSMGVFLYFDYLRPQVSNTKGTTIVTEEDAGSNTFSLPEASGEESESSDSTSSSESTDSTDSTSSSESTDSTDSTSSSESTDSTDSSSSSSRKGSPSHGSRGSHSDGGSNTGNTNTTEIQSDSVSLSISEATVTKVNSYRDDNIQITINKKEVGEGNDKVTYYVADIYVTNVKYLKSAFADGTYGKNITDSVQNMAEENNAILAVNGDFYGNSEEGVVIRNGVLYRSDIQDADVCVLFKDGTMKTYEASEFDADSVVADGAWQAWTFGPQLLDGSGNVCESFNTTSYLNGENPRCAIGYVEAGHYMLVAVDGRNEGYSRGVSLTEMAEIMSQEGCQSAYNMDGGKSVAMAFKGEYVNQPADGGRDVSDIIYIGE